MLHVLFESTAPRRVIPNCLLAIALGMAVAACGGADDPRSSDAVSKSRALAANDATPSSSSAAMTSPNTASPVTPPPRSPSEGQLLRDEIERLEQQGVLPKLDRGTDIAGPDADHNGIRDDIDAYIAALPITDLQRKALLQRARAQQAKLLLDPTDKAAIAAASQRSMAAAHCMWSRFNGTDDLSPRIEALTANTPERATRFIRYMAALSGTSIWAADGETCEP